MPAFFTKPIAKGALFFATCLFMTWNLAGCSAEIALVEEPPGVLNDVDMPNRSLAFGFIDTAALHFKVEWVTLQWVGTPRGKLRLKAHVERGFFFLENLIPGAYRVTSFGGHFEGTLCQRSLKCKYPVTYQLPPDSRIFQFKIKQERIFSLGAARATSQNVDFEAPQAVKLHRIPNPPEHEMIERILPYAKGTAWFARLQARLKKLERKNR